MWSTISAQSNILGKTTFAPQTPTKRKKKRKMIREIRRKFMALLVKQAVFQSFSHHLSALELSLSPEETVGEG